MRRRPCRHHAPARLLGTDRRRCRSRANGDEDAELGAEEGGAPGGGGDEGENRTVAGKCQDQPSSLLPINRTVVSFADHL
jgi:hypothetical protein